MTCGGGQRSRVRLCDSPLPEAGGSLCPSNELFSLSITDDGTLKESGTETCNNNDCPTTTDTGKMRNDPFLYFENLLFHIYYYVSIRTFVYKLMAAGEPGAIGVLVR